MPFIKPFTTPDGLEHPNSFWRLYSLQSYGDISTTIVTFKAWHDLATHNAGAKPLATVEREYKFGGAQHQAALATTITSAQVGKTLYEVLAAAAETQLLLIPDAVDAQGNPANFFADAHRV